MGKNKFVDNDLMRIRGKLSEVSGETANGIAELNGDDTSEGKVPSPVRLENQNLEREKRKALYKRWEEFRNLRREVAARLSEKQAAIPEEIRIEELRIAELRSALERFAGMLDELGAIDDSAWDKKADFGADLGLAVKQVDNMRLEYLRLTAKLAALQRESDAAENLPKQVSMLPELNSLSLKQGFRLGLIFFLPLILTILIAAIALVAGIYFSMH